MLIQLLDYFRSQGKLVSTFTLLQADVVIRSQPARAIAKWRPPAVKILDDHLPAASSASQAYRQPTPKHWLNLLAKDLRVLPQFCQTHLQTYEDNPGNTIA